jgi:hypothetical protein
MLELIEILVSFRLSELMSTGKGDQLPMIKVEIWIMNAVELYGQSEDQVRPAQPRSSTR